MLEYYVDKPTLGESLPKNMNATFNKLGQSKNNMIYTILLSDGQRTQDWYAFLTKDRGVWKLRAVRRLALPGIFYVSLDQLKGKFPRTKKEEWDYQNMLLTTRSDSELKGYLKDHLAEFRNIVSLQLKGRTKLSELAAKQLYISNIKKESGRFELTIGGILDNSVGYLYVPSGKKPPTMSPRDYICIEEIIDGWYLYKTT